MLYKALLRRASPAGPRARLTVLIFHRVLPRADPLQPDEVEASRFDAICRWVRAWFNVLPLDEAVRRLAAGALPERSLAITFDDGYADNFRLALPILRRHGLPATFFVATGFLNGGRMWNDTVIEAVRGTTLDRADLDDLLPSPLGTLELGSAGQRLASIGRLIDAIKYLPLEKRLEAAGQVAARMKTWLPDDLMMTSGQLRMMRRAGMQIGAHTVSHPILAVLDAATERNEIVQGKRALEELLDEPVRLFAYPNGMPGRDFTDDSVRLVRELGFDAAVTTEAGVAAAGTDPWRIPRFTPWDRGRLKFAARLAANFRNVAGTGGAWPKVPPEPRPADARRAVR